MKSLILFLIASCLLLSCSSNSFVKRKYTDGVFLNTIGTIDKSIHPNINDDVIKSEQNVAVLTETTNNVDECNYTKTNNIVLTESVKIETKSKGIVNKKVLGAVLSNLLPIVNNSKFAKSIKHDFEQKPNQPKVVMIVKLILYIISLTLLLLLTFLILKGLGKI